MIRCRCAVCNYEWDPKPNNLLNGEGCPKCAGNVRKTNEEFVDELNEISPTIIPLETYVNAKKQLLLRCGVCGYEWKNSPHGLLGGAGCPKCAGNIKKTNKEFLEELYSISPSIQPLEDYKGARTKVLCRCLVCDYKWSATPDILLNQKSGCPKCNNRLKKLVRCIETGVIYSSIVDAGNQTGISRQCIGLCCNKKTKSAGGFHWEFYEQE